MKPPRRNSKFSKQKYTKTRVKKHRPYNPNKTGILDRVRSAFNKDANSKAGGQVGNAPPINQASSTNTSSGSSSSNSSSSNNTSTTTTPTRSLAERRVDWEAKLAKDAADAITAENNKLVDSSGNTKPSGSTILDRINDGTAIFSNIKGGYERNASDTNYTFKEDATGKNLRQVTDATGNVAGNINQFTGRPTKNNNSAVYSSNAFKPNYNTDMFGNKTSTMSGVINKLAAREGLDKHSQEYRDYVAKARHDITQIEDSRKIYDRNYNYADHLGIVGPDGNIPSGYNFGGGDRKDLAMLDTEGGGLGTPYTRINNQSISRMGRYVNTNKGSGVANMVWENQNVGSTDNLEDNPYQRFYWANPELEGKAPSKGGVISKIKGLSYQDMNEADKDALNKTIAGNQEDQFYGSSLLQQFNEDYDLSYDFNNSDAPWVFKNESGESTGNIGFHGKDLKIK